VRDNVHTVSLVIQNAPVCNPCYGNLCYFDVGNRNYGGNRHYMSNMTYRFELISVRLCKMFL